MSTTSPPDLFAFVRSVIPVARAIGLLAVAALVVLLWESRAHPRPRR